MLRCIKVVKSIWLFSLKCALVISIMQYAVNRRIMINVRRKKHPP